MLPLQDLRFAQHYPFSKTAATVVRQAGLSLEEVPTAVMQRARLMLSSALSSKDYKPLAQESAELIQNEVLAFPVAKILLSFSRNTSYFERFAALLAGNSFKRFEFEKPELLLDFASELGIRFELSEGKDFFASVPVIDFLKIPQSTIAMHLVNQKLQAGKVFLAQEEFARLLSEAVKLKVFQSLPADVKKVPKEFQKIAFEVFSEISAKQREYLKQVLHGKASVESFPPCFSELYSKISSGEKLSHLGNFTLASFLIAVNTPREQVLNVFKKAANYDERIATYHIDRMSRGKKYTPASCNTMRSYALCIQNGALCPNIKNPLQYYRRRIFSKARSGRE